MINSSISLLEEICLSFSGSEKGATFPNTIDSTKLVTTENGKISSLHGLSPDSMSLSMNSTMLHLNPSNPFKNRKGIKQYECHI